MNGYGRLIQRVKKVNRQAALIMARELPLLNRRGLLQNGLGNHSTLLESFVWEETKQGHKYWVKIHLILSR